LAEDEPSEELRKAIKREWETKANQGDLEEDENFNSDDECTSTPYTQQLINVNV